MNEWSELLTSVGALVSVVAGAVGGLLYFEYKHQKKAQSRIRETARTLSKLDEVSTGELVSAYNNLFVEVSIAPYDNGIELISRVEGELARRINSELEESVKNGGERVINKSEIYNRIEDKPTDFQRTNPKSRILRMVYATQK